jgi:Holliday junction resolvasome RuvABC endonuclease subunit
VTALALDIATRTGWAFGDPARAAPLWPRPLASAPLAFGVFVLPGDAGEGRTFALFADWLGARLSERRTERIAIEAPFIHPDNASQPMTRRLFGLRAMALVIAHRAGIPVVELAPSSVKKRFAGKGNAEKLAVIEENWRRGYAPNDDNEADAIALWHAAFAPERAAAAKAAA